MRGTMSLRVIFGGHGRIGMELYRDNVNTGLLWEIIRTYTRENRHTYTHTTYVEKSYQIKQIEIFQLLIYNEFKLNVYFFKI